MSKRYCNDNIYSKKRRGKKGRKVIKTISIEFYIYRIYNMCSNDKQKRCKLKYFLLKYNNLLYTEKCLESLFDLCTHNVILLFKLLHQN